MSRHAFLRSSSYAPSKLCSVCDAPREALIHAAPEKEIPMTEYRKGDKIRITDVAEVTVDDVDKHRIVAVDGVAWTLNPGWTRTIEIVERAAAPWQAGDIAVTAANVRLIRQSSGAWFNHLGHDVKFTDADIESRYTAVVRGGRKV